MTDTSQGIQHISYFIVYLMYVLNLPTLKHTLTDSLGSEVPGVIRLLQKIALL